MYEKKTHSSWKCLPFKFILLTTTTTAQTGKMNFELYISDGNKAASLCFN